MNQPESKKNTMTEKSSIKNRLINQSNFILYLIISIALIFIINRFPIRFDLTKDNKFTLSKASKTVVTDLQDPLRIKVFYSKNLPPPLNEMEVVIRDLLEEYRQVANQNFSYTFYNVTEKDGETSETIKQNIALANEYGIRPQQVQSVDKDELKLVKVYLGMTVEYGDLIERFPFISSGQNLEFKLTSMFQRMNRKINKLLSLQSNIEIQLLLDQQFVQLAPFFNVTGLDGLEQALKPVIEKVKKQNYGKLDFQLQSKLNEVAIKDLTDNGIRVYPWEGFSIPNKGSYPAGVGVAVLKVISDDRVKFVEMLRPESVLQLGKNGLQQTTQFKLIDLASFDETLNGVIESLLEVNDNVAYLSDHNTLSVTPSQPTMFQPQGTPADGANALALMNKTYKVDPISLDLLTPKYKSLVIAGAKEKFSDYELYVIDQFLMQGKSLIVLEDSYYNEQVGNPAAQLQRQMPKWVANNTGLNKMLSHYGVEVEKAYVLDKQSFIARQPNQNGGYEEQPIYFAPMIQASGINHDFRVLKNINQFVSLEVSPVKLIKDRVNSQGLNTIKLFSSSKDSWLMKDNVMLLPHAIRPPLEKDKYKARDLGYVLEGKFESYFKGKSIPVRDESTTNQAKSGGTSQQPSFAESAATAITVSKPAKILVLGGSALLKNNLIDANGVQPNAALMLNLIDYMNDRGDWASMRGKGQQRKPLTPYTEESSFLTNRDFLKTFNIVGLPILVFMVGLLNLFIRNRRRKALQKVFQ